MKLLAFLMLIFVVLIVGAIIVLYHISTWVTHHYESSADWIWTVETDDFDTIKALSASGRLMTLKLSWSWFNLKWMYVAQYDAYRDIDFWPVQ